MPQPQKLETLDDLLAQAADYAEFCLRNSGSMPLTLFLIGADGPFLCVPETLADESGKDAFATNARLLCIAHAASAVVTAMEAWVSCAKPGEKLDMTERPSEAFDRREFVVLIGESHTGPKQKFLPIIRSDNGNFFGFDDSEAPTMDEMQGRFAEILSPKSPDAAARSLAKAMLKIKGVKAIKTTPPVPRPRSRR